MALSTGSQFGPSAKWHDWFAIDPAEEVVIGDYDGDGKDDILTWLSGRTWQTYVALSTGAGMTEPRIWLDRIGDDSGDTLYAGDGDGDGRDDLILLARSRGEVWVARSAGNRFLAPVRWHDFFAVSVFERPRVGDLDGDGRDDILTFATDSPTAFGDVYVALSTGASFGATAKWHDWFAVSPQETIRVGDHDGDGRDDVFTFLQQPEVQAYIVASEGTGLGPNRVLEVAGMSHGARDRHEVGDADGDGYADIITFLDGRVWVILLGPAVPLELRSDQQMRAAYAARARAPRLSR